METYYQSAPASCMACHHIVSNALGRDFVAFMALEASGPPAGLVHAREPARDLQYLRSLKTCGLIAQCDRRFRIRPKASRQMSNSIWQESGVDPVPDFGLQGRQRARRVEALIWLNLLRSGPGAKLLQPLRGDRSGFEEHIRLQVLFVSSRRGVVFETKGVDCGAL